VRRANDDPASFVMAGHTQTLAGAQPGIFAMRTDPLGNPVWTKTYGRAPGLVYREKLELRNCAGGYIICGSVIVVGTGNELGVLLRIDDLGNQLWMQTYEEATPDFDYTNFKDVAEIPGGFVVTGHARTLAPPGMFQNSTETILLAVDSLGVPVWAQQYANVQGDDSGESLAILSQGYAVVGGHTAMPVGGLPTTILFTTDGAGTLQWYRRIGNVLDGGSHYHGAIANGTLRALAGGDLVFVGGDLAQDAALVRFDAGGAFQAAGTYGFSASQYGTSVLVEPAAAGYTFVGPVSDGFSRDYYVVRTDTSFVSGCHESTLVPPIDIPPVSPTPIAFALQPIADVVPRVPLEPPLSWTETLLCESTNCVDPLPLACSVSFLTVTLTWPSLPATVGIAEVWRDGAFLATVTGTSYADTPPLGPHTYELRLHDTNPNCDVAISSCSALVGQSSPVVGITDVIAFPWKPILDEPIICWADALTAKGRVPGFVRSIAEIRPDLGSAIPDVVPVVWLSLGDFPGHHELAPAEAQALALVLAAGGALYIEGGDVAFGAQNALTAIDGVDAIADGDALGLVPGLIGLDSGVGLDATALSAGYSGTGRSIDHLAPAGSGAGAIFQNAGAPGQTTAVFFDAALAGTGTHRVITSSTGIHGYDGDRDALLDAYVSALSPPVELIRGDTNDDGGVDIADAITLLSSLFPGAGTPAPLGCGDAADANDDGGIDIADAIALLSSLFGSPTVPLPIPNAATGCGGDATLGDPLDCAAYGGCP